MDYSFYLRQRFLAGGIWNQFFVFCFVAISIGLIGYMDLLTGSEFSFSIFYVIPIALCSITKGVSRTLILVCSIMAAITWFVVEYNTNHYSHIIMPVWNCVMRLIIFIAIGLLLFSLKEKQKKLEEVNDKLNTINDEKNRIIGIAAHDIRNPLGAINSFSELLLADEVLTGNKESNEILKFIKILSEDLLVLIKNLLDVSKIESGKLEMNYENLNYVNFVKQQLVVNQLLGKKKNININLESSDDIILAEFDKQYMSQVINNLLSNAIKFSWKSSEILIKIERKHNNQILTQVIDYGQGIPEDEQKKLFNYFQKTSIQPTDGEQSTGLGLAIVKKIVLTHNGEVCVKNVENKGSNFYFTFPISRIVPTTT